jgi:RNA polymerase sigma-70 factor (ECF subfamily)
VFLAEMSLSEQNLRAITGGARDFRTTQWSLVLKAGRGAEAEAAAALDKLCRAYWYPLYAFVRRRGYDSETARDLTQSFFAALLARNQFAVADPARGRFRSFLVHSLSHFLANEWRDAQRLKRGGGAVVFSLDGLEPEERYRLEPAVESDAEKIFERRWAYTMVERALARLRSEHERTGKGAVFAELAGFLPGGAPGGTMAEAARRLGLSEGAVKVAVHRLRQRFREVFREEIAETVDAPQQVDEEVRHVIEALSY